MNEIPRVAYQGEPGAFSEQAAIQLLGSRIRLVPQPTFDALFAAIRGGAADYALAPVENSLAGAVARVRELLRESGLRKLDEVTLPIALHLIASPGTRWQEVARVESHPMALAQCGRFFAQHPHLQRVMAEDTAGSVQAVVAAGDRTRAAIAGARAARLYGGVTLLDHLEDDPANCTRFFLLAPP